MNTFTKKFIAILMLMSISPIQAVFAADDMEYKIIKNVEIFDNNYQNNKTTDNKRFSPIEQIFNNKENYQTGSFLVQRGYNFNTNSGATSSAVGRYGNDFKLSVGTKVNIYLYGDAVDVISASGSNLLLPSSKSEVGSDGNIFVSGIGSIKAENRTIGDVEREINSIAKSKYQDLSVKISISSGNEFTVFVYGEVNRPGKVYVGNNSSIYDVLGAAGGVKKTGTLRNIKYNKNTVDLYKDLFLGTGSNILVKANDTIFVDKIGNVAAVKNGVQNPGIYELKANETINDLIKYAGGLLVTTAENEVTLVGFDKASGQKEGKNIAWYKAKNTKLSNGDAIEFKELYNGVENLVTIQGNVKHPGTYAYKKGMRLSDILKSTDELLEETFITQAVIRRVSGKNNTIETIPVFLEEFFSGMNDPILEPQDVISVYKSTNSAFVDVYGCINAPQHMPYKKGMTLKDAISDLKFIESNVNENDKTDFDATPEGENIQLVASTQNSNKVIPTENVAVEITNKSGQTRIFYLYDVMINSDRINSINIAPEDKIFFRTLRGNEVLKKVKIAGFVKQPGVYTFVKGRTLTDMIELAGGLTEEADIRGIVYKRSTLQSKQTDIAKKNNERDIQLLIGRVAGGYKQEANAIQTKLGMIDEIKEETGNIAKKYNGQIALNIKDNDIEKISKLDNIEVEDGDDIYIPRISNHVSVVGEVYNEQSFVYKKGSRANMYIKQVGGYTPNANKFRIYKVGVNGRAEKIGRTAKVEPGDTIVVPRRIAGNDWITPITQTLSGLASVFIMVFGINKW